MTQRIIEDTVEQATLGWLGTLGWDIAHGPDISPGGSSPERESYSEVVLIRRLYDSLTRINSGIPTSGIEEALRQIIHEPHPTLTRNNRHFHKMLIDGVTVEYANADGEIERKIVWVVDFDNPSNNDWLAVNQFTVVEDQERRPDIVCFINGLPIAVIELKNPTDPNATLRSAYNQLQTYKNQITSLFTFNELLVIADGVEARVGSLTSGWDRFMPWRVVEDEKDLRPPLELELPTLVNGLFEKSRLLSFLRDFIVFHQSGDDQVNKIIAGYHQYHATLEAVDATIYASGEQGDGRIGVIWHTQGSGKSLTMVFYARMIALHKEMKNPTIVVLTDRQDLDNQLFATFSDSQDLLRQTPKQAKERQGSPRGLRELLTRDSGGVVFTTVQKFMPRKDESRMPELCARKNLVIIADEAHRSQYDFINGFARHLRDALPNASFIGFTGTPIEVDDRNTQAVFGDYVSVYDMKRAQADGAVVPIHFESRIALLNLDDDAMATIDEDFEEVTEGEEGTDKEKLKTKWATLEALVGSEDRVANLVDDLLEHWKSRLEIIDGKAMIVCMSRRICVDMYNAICARKPDWASSDDDQGRIKVMMTGSASDPEDWQEHIRNKARKDRLANRFRDPNDDMQIVIVRDMWLTGFSASSLNTMYVDKPMRGHGLMQAIARVNRVFKDKPGGLIVDYIGLADPLRKAVLIYTDSGGKGDIALDISKAASVLVEKHEVITIMFHDFDWTDYSSDDRTARLQCLLNAQNHILGLEDGKNRYNESIYLLNKSYAIAKTTPEAEQLRDDIVFFRDVHGRLNTRSAAARDPGEIDSAIRQLVSDAIQPGEVIDVFEAAGLKRPDISILDDEFLAEIQRMPHRNLAVELLEKLLKGELRQRRRVNLVQQRIFSEMLESVLIRYRNRGMDTLQVIEDLIELAKKMREASARGEDLGLDHAELAFYDALETNDSAVEVLGDEILKTIARDVAKIIRNSTTIDWTMREEVQAQMRVLVKRILKKYGYPPDKRKKATETVLEQAKLMASELASA